MIPREKKRKATKQSDVGTLLHEILFEELGPRRSWEDEFLEALEDIEDAKLGFARPYGDSIITGHPDDFQVTLDGDVTLIEHKTTEIKPFKPKSLRLIEKYKVPMAEFQLKIYCWIFDYLLTRKTMTGYRLARTHAVQYWYVNHKEGKVQLIDTYPFTYYPWSVEHDVKQALEAYLDKTKIIRPRPWKCRQCPKRHQAKCQFKQR